MCCGHGEFRKIKIKPEIRWRSLNCFVDWFPEKSLSLRFLALALVFIQKFEIVSKIMKHPLKSNEGFLT